jgi:hypothetical protein
LVRTADRRYSRLYSQNKKMFLKFAAAMGLIYLCVLTGNGKSAEMDKNGAMVWIY